MPERVAKSELIQRLAKRAEVDEKTASFWLGTVTETVYESIKAGESVTLPNLGNFYVKANGSDTWVCKFNPAQRLRALLRWSSTYKGDI